MSDRIDVSFTKDELDTLAALLESANAELEARLKKAVFPERLINLTGHQIDIYDLNNQLVKSIPPDRDYPVCRANAKKTVTGTICGVPFYETVYPSVNNLPMPEPNTKFIVSRVVAYSTEPRDDLLVIDMQVKDDTGKTIGYRGRTRV